MNRTLIVGLASVLIVAAGIGGWWLGHHAAAIDDATTSPTTSLPSADKVLTEADNGKTITIAQNQALAIRLDTGSDGGYQWSLDSYDHAILNLTDLQTVEPVRTSPKMVGGNSTQQWTFMTLKAGTSKIQLTNFRSFEPRPAAPTFSVTVTVQ